MNYHTLAKFILVLGLVVTGFGGIKFAANRPVPAERPRMASNTLAAMADFAYNMGNAAAADDENMERSYQRQKAVKVIGVGAAIIFVAVAMMKSARKSKPDDAI